MTIEPPDEPGPDSATPPPSEPPAPDTETTRMPWEVEPTAAPPPIAGPVPPTAAGWAALPPSPPPPSAVPPPGTGQPAPAAPTPSVLWAQPSTEPRLEVPGAPGLSFADTASRFIGWLIDSFIVGVIGTIVAAALGLGRTTVIQNGSTVIANTSVSGAAFAVPFALIGLAYFVFFWTGGRRATPGQQIFHLQVGNAFDGQGLTPTQAVRRWVGYGSWIGLFAIVWTGATFVEFIWVIALLVTTVRSSTKQGLHDRFANSAVVRPSSESSKGLATACLVIIAITVLFAVFAIIALIFLGSQVSGILRDAGNSV